ncbi:MAG: substrate-binding domain-containing protein [bacterium]
MLGPSGWRNRKRNASASRRRIWLLARVIIYIAIVVLLYLNRGGVPWRRLAVTLRGTGSADTTLTIAGRDLAPVLVDRLVAHYQREYPDLAISVTGGGTNQALEDLLNGRSSAAFLYRRPSRDEEELFRAIDGDTAIVVPVAVGGVILVAGDAADARPVTLDDVRRLLTGDAAGRCERFYVPEPNEGLWDAVRANLGLSDPSPSSPFLVYLADAPAVLDAVSNDDHAWGIVSSLNAPLDPGTDPPPGVRIVSLRAGPGESPLLPTYENVATGAYPLYHRLYLACRENGSREGGKFLTHLASARGLRQVERAGVVPARQILREIYLTTTPVGE